jgi:probable F420-dependent oxidoreductase
MPRPFRFSVQSTTAASGTEWKDRARQAEDLGYSTIHLADHYVDPKSNGGQVLAAVPAMATAAAVTSTLHIGCRVFCSDYQSPAVLAKNAATLDLLSDGRLELGLGAGWVASEYEQMGLTIDRAPVRIARLAEVVDYVKTFCAGGQLPTGFAGAPVTPQQPHPPIMIGGGSRKVLTLAGQVADIVSFNFDNSEGKVGAKGVGSSTAENMDAKVGWVRDGAGDRFDQLELEVGAYFTVVTDDVATAAGGMAKMFGLSAEQMVEHPNALIGSVPEIVDRLQQRRDRYGFSYVAVPDRAMAAFAPVVEQLAGK